MALLVLFGLAAAAPELQTLPDAGAASGAAVVGPCDILAASHNPCVAAHSTVRALYATYRGPLYRVQRLISSNCSGGKFMERSDWLGDNDQTQLGVRNIEECCAACAEQSGCNHFSLTYSSMQCYLKGGHRVLVANNGSTAGYCTKGPSESANISVLDTGFADVAAHEKFCAAGDCVIAELFDQSPQGNHLHQRISTVSGQRVVHKMVNASRHKIAVRDDAAVFGMWFDAPDANAGNAGYGYNVDFTRGVATGNEPESIYAVMSGTHFNDKCCFD